MRAQGRMLRAGALTSVGVLALHELRFLLTPVRGETAAHGYLSVLEPVVVVAFVLAACTISRRLALTRQVTTARQGAGTARLWAGTSALLLAAYCMQEALEGWLAPDHPAGLAGIFGAGGWIAVPLAVALGGLIALALRGIRSIQDAPRTANRLIFAPPLATSIGLPHAAPAPLDAVARNLAGRGPPYASV